MTDQRENGIFGSAVATNEEPWVRLDRSVDTANWQHDDEVRHNQRNRQTQKHQFYVNVFDYLKENRIEGDYYEFGCHRVRTFRMALSEAHHQNMDSMRFLAFDSFHGLPSPTSEPSLELWHQPGILTTSVDDFRELVNQHGIYTDRVDTFEGYYDESLTVDLQASLIERGSKIALVTIDCDLYESAVPVFKFIEPLLQAGSALYIDDMFVGYKGSPANGVCRAFLEFQQTSRFNYIRHMDVGWWGRSYIACTPDSSIPDVLL
jgi:hypothetical protein